MRPKVTSGRGPAFGAASISRKTPIKNDPVFGDQSKSVANCHFGAVSDFSVFPDLCCRLNGSNRTAILIMTAPPERTQPTKMRWQLYKITRQVVYFYSGHWWSVAPALTPQFDILEYLPVWVDKNRGQNLGCFVAFLVRLTHDSRICPRLD